MIVPGSYNLFKFHLTLKIFYAKKMKKYKYYLLLLNLFLFLSTDLYCQIKPDPLLKIGGFIYINPNKNNFYPYVFIGNSLNIEYEKAFRKNQFLTYGLRLDYLYQKPIWSRNLYLGCELKFYPIFIKKNKPYQGLFMGINSFYIFKDQKNDFNKYGPGIGIILGWQFLIRNKISLSYEIIMNYYQNLNELSKKNPQNRYFGFVESIKIGFKL